MYSIVFPGRPEFDEYGKIIRPNYMKYKEWYDYLEYIDCEILFAGSDDYGIRFFKDGVEVHRCLGMTDFCDFIELEWGKPSKVWKVKNKN